MGVNRPRTGAWSNTLAPRPISSMAEEPSVTAVAAFLSDEWIDALDEAGEPSRRARTTCASWCSRS